MPSGTHEYETHYCQVTHRQLQQCGSLYSFVFRSTIRNICAFIVRISCSLSKTDIWEASLNILISYIFSKGGKVLFVSIYYYANWSNSIGYAQTSTTINQNHIFFYYSNYSGYSSKHSFAPH